MKQLIEKIKGLLSKAAASVGPAGKDEPAKIEPAVKTAGTADVDAGTADVGTATGGMTDGVGTAAGGDATVIATSATGGAKPVVKKQGNALELLLVRKGLEDRYTIGFLYVNENGSTKYLCDVLEDKVRDVNKNGVFDGNEKKVYGETAIPYGRYEIDMKTVSPAMKNKTWSIKYNGIVPRLKNVPSFSGILIHPGNTTKDTSGCLLVGENKSEGTVSNSTKTYYMLMDEYLIPARNAGRRIYIEIV